MKLTDKQLAFLVWLVDDVRFEYVENMEYEKEYREMTKILHKEVVNRPIKIPKYWYEEEITTNILREDCCRDAQVEKQKDIDTNEIFYECQSCGTQSVAFENTKEGKIEAINAWNNFLL